MADEEEEQQTLTYESRKTKVVSSKDEDSSKSTMRIARIEFKSSYYLFICCRWSAIAAQLPGRTDNEIKNHWHTYLKKCTRQQIPISQAQKPRSNDRSKSKKTGQKTSKFKISSVSPSTHQIFESSQFSPPPPPPLSSELCSLMIDTATVNSPSSIAENDVSPSEMFAETNASFWTDPIFVDNYDNTYDVLSPLVVDTGFLSPHTPVIDEEFLCSYNFYDEFNNVLNW
ncbi:hypothetical protein HYC85_014366 [Camellia sinensis]|uniref:HTH myb-type domain-containing protein n=1 Tax=Camellia sinensis TaxID=4442 RepID=A0A7J7H6A4_CAMSI|nr:hypothetical protein HYC85_014366 [Camellia sinensis]